jgi:hypothetical protein
MLLESADVVLQDDTGIPYRFLSQSPWQVKLWSVPQTDPSDGVRLSKDLEAAFNNKSDLPDAYFLLAIIGVVKIRFDRRAPKLIVSRTRSLLSFSCPHGARLRQSSWPTKLQTSDGVILVARGRGIQSRSDALTIVLVPGWSMPADICKR